MDFTGQADCVPRPWEAVPRPWEAPAGKDGSGPGPVGSVGEPRGGKASSYVGGSVASSRARPSLVENPFSIPTTLQATLAVFSVVLC